MASGPVLNRSLRNLNITKHRGAISELTACSWLLEKGYEVFRNVSQHGVADLVAINRETQEILQIDVKTIGKTVMKGLTYKTVPKPNERHKQFGVEVLVVDGEQCFFSGSPT